MTRAFDASGGTGSAPDLRSYLSVVWRQKFVILPLVVVLPLVVHLRSDPPAATYEASATVLLNRQSQGLSGLPDPTLWDVSRMIRTQAQLARMPEVARHVADAAQLPGLDAGAFMGKSSVSSDDTENDLLVFSVRDEEPQIAVRLANLYAAKYIEFRRELDTKALRESARLVAQQMEEMNRQGIDPMSQAYQALLSRQQQLETAESLQASNALLVREATSAARIGSRERRTLILALGLGLILGLGLAFLIDTLDTRIRSTEDLTMGLGLPLLGTIPPPRRRLRQQRKLAMLHDEDGAGAEPYRILRARIEMALPDDCRSFMVTSALEGEGKSTTAANLAVAMARAGQHVILVDLDLHRPGLERWFRVPTIPGATDVAMERVSLREALRTVPLPRPKLSSLPERMGLAEVSTNGRGGGGTLEILTAGSLTVGPEEIIRTSAFERALAEMRARADIVVVDGPPLLLSGQAVSLCAKLDGLLVVSRLNLVREKQLAELSRILASCPATKLGLVVLGAPGPAPTYAYGYRARGAREHQRQLTE